MKDDWIQLPDILIKKSSVIAVFFISGGMSSGSRSVSKMRINYVSQGVFHSSEVIATQPQFLDFCKLIKN